MAKQLRSTISRAQYGNYIDLKAIADFEFFLNKVSERTDKQFGLRETYVCDDPALAPDVEFFGFNILQDDRMRYIIENIVSLPDNELSQANKIGNTIISHFYGVRGIHTIVTGIKDPKKAHVDFERLTKDQDYLNYIKEQVSISKRNGKKFYGTTELHTSLQTAARNFCRKKYADDSRPASLMDILEWVADWTIDGTVDRILKVKSLKEMYHLLCEKPGVGAYYGYHCSTSNSVNPALSYQHDENFCSPGPGARESLDLIFKPLKDAGAKLDYGDLTIWIRENQKSLFSNIHIHPFFHNIQVNGQNIFKDQQNELKVYGTEVGLCQFGVYCYLKKNPHLISKRKVARDDEDVAPTLKTASLLEF